MNLYADGPDPAWDVGAGSGEFLFEHADASSEWVAESGWDTEAVGESGPGMGAPGALSPVWPERSFEDVLADGEAIPVAAILPALAQLAPVLLQAAPAIIGAVQTAMPALQQLLQGFAQGGAPGVLTRGREMASETAVLEATLTAMESLLVGAGVGTPYSNALVEPPESRFAHLEGGEFLPALAGIVAALAPVVGQVITAVTSRRPAPPPARPSRPVAAPALPAAPAAGVGAGQQALAILPQLLPLLAQLATQLAAPPAGNAGAIAPVAAPGPAPAA